MLSFLKQEYNIFRYINVVSIAIRDVVKYLKSDVENPPNFVFDLVWFIKSMYWFLPIPSSLGYIHVI